MVIVFNGQTFEKKLYSTIFFPFTHGHLLVAKGQAHHYRLSSNQVLEMPGSSCRGISKFFPFYTGVGLTEV